MNRAKVECHAEGDICFGCPHYYGKEDVCEYANYDYRSQVEKQADEIQRLTKENERLRRIVQDFDHLIGESGGVYGLHLNGDLAPWDEIMPGGRFEEWLVNYGEPE